jgi:hypothetical protein
MNTGMTKVANHAELASLLPHTVWVFLPSESGCPTCGYDEFTRGAKDIACTICGGRGKITTWRRSALKARINWIDAAKPVYGLLTTGEVGDVWLTLPLRDRPAMEAVQRSRRAYLLVDNRHVRPFAINSNSVIGQTTLDVRCNIVTEEL